MYPLQDFTHSNFTLKIRKSTSRPGTTKIILRPIDTTSMSSMKVTNGGRDKNILSISTYLDKMPKIDPESPKDSILRLSRGEFLKLKGIVVEDMGVVH